VSPVPPAITASGLRAARSATHHPGRVQRLLDLAVADAQFAGDRQHRTSLPGVALVQVAVQVAGVAELGQPGREPPGGGRRRPLPLRLDAGRHLPPPLQAGAARDLGGVGNRCAVQPCRRRCPGRKQYEAALIRERTQAGLAAPAPAAADRPQWTVCLADLRPSDTCRWPG
jgi:hypothetical protein